jgi:hypothetical protein
LFTYGNGTEVKVGDSVLFERGRTSGIVELIVLTDSELSEIGVREQGIMLLSAPFGRVYLPTEALHADPLQFVSRKPDGPD